MGTQSGSPGHGSDAFTALVLAGSRPGGDPLAAAAGVTHKALAPVAGVAMLTRVVRALRAAATVRRVILCGIERDTLAAEPPMRELVEAGVVRLIDSRATPAASVLAAMATLAPCTPLLVATADHPLLTPALIDDFCAGAAASGADVAVGLVAAGLVQRAFPAIRRTTIPFRDGTYCGCNLFALLTPAAQRAPAAWMRVERHRKRPWRMVRELGVGPLLRFALRRLTLAQVMQLASERMAVRVRPVLLNQPEAGFDVDTLPQLEAAAAFLRARDGA